MYLSEETATIAPNARSHGIVTERSLFARAAWPVAAVAVFVFFIATLVVDSHRLLWYDEISTTIVVRLPSLSAIWHAMLQPVDASTPTYFFLERMVDTAFHHTPLAARLLSSIAVALGLLLAFDCVARLAGAWPGLVALGVLMCSFLPDYAYEARAYGLVFLLSTAAFWLWCHARANPRRFVLLFGACFFLGELTHYYFALCLTPYVAYQLLKRETSREQLRATIAAVGGIGLAGVLLLPAALAVRQLSANFWAATGLSSLNSFSRFFPHAMVSVSLCALCLAFLTFLRKPEPAVRIAGPSSDEQLGWLFLLIPIAGLVLARFVTHAFVERYFIGFLPGVALAVACLCDRLSAHRRSTIAVIAGILLIFGLARQVHYALHPELEAGPFSQQQVLTLPAKQVEPAILADGKQFIIVRDPVLFLEARYNSPHPGMYPFLAELAIMPNERTNRLTLEKMSRLGWFQTWTVSQLEAHADSVALIDPGEALMTVLARKGFRLTARILNPIPVFYVAKR